MIVYDDISLRFNGKDVFSGLSLVVNRAEKVLLSGKSGLGKTSLFYMLLGFLLPDKGNIFFEDRKIDGISVWGLRKKIAFVPQDLNIGFGKTGQLIRDYLAFRTNACANFCSEEISGLLDLFELEKDILDKDIDELSGGEKQRIAIIIALLLKRDVFLLDEPTSFLDGRLKEKTAALFFEKKDATVLVVSHDKIWHDNNVKMFSLEDKIWVR